MADIEINKPLITLEFSDDSIEYFDEEELSTFNQNERNQWSWLNQATQQDNNLNQTWTLYNNYWGEIDRFLQQLRRHHDNENQKNQLKEHLKHQTQQAVKQGYYQSESATAQFIFSLKDKSMPQVAGFALAFIMKKNTNFNTAYALEGAYRALQFLQGSTETAEAQQKTLSLIKQKWSTNFTTQHNQLRQQNEQIISEIDSLRTEYGEIVTLVKKQAQDQEDLFNKNLQETEKTLKDIEHTYDSKLALQSSVQYWKIKRTHHQWVMLSLGIITLVLALITGGAFIWAAYELLKETFIQVPLWKLGVMIGISSFGVWLTRLSAKIFISNLHLRTDADERVTMIQTYLALLREGSGPKDDERQLILQTLFRPSTTGFIKDDGPAMFYESIVKMNK